MLVLDANAFLWAAAVDDGFRGFRREDLVAPPLMWAEARSVLHVAVSRGLVERRLAERSLQILDSGLVRERRHSQLGRETWRIADELGWQKTYDAEYLALARLLKAQLVTLDSRMLRAAEHLGVAAEAPRR